jgi:hypothetical protein
MHGRAIPLLVAKAAQVCDEKRLKDKTIHTCLCFNIKV